MRQLIASFPDCPIASFLNQVPRGDLRPAAAPSQFGVNIFLQQAQRGRRALGRLFPHNRRVSVVDEHQLAGGRAIKTVHSRLSLNPAYAPGVTSEVRGLQDKGTFRSLRRYGED